MRSIASAARRPSPAWRTAPRRLPRVDKIVGPGNLFVVLAKRMVFGQVGIEALPGPTECLVVADDSANPAWVAADLLAQAEHDPLACSLLITPDHALAERSIARWPSRSRRLPRRAIVEESLANRGGIVETRDLDEAIDLANAFAGEHLCLAVRDPWTWLGKVRHAGGVFLGELNAEAIGDYTAGPSHIMPTGGTARFSSPVNVDDFLKIISVFGLSPTTCARPVRRRSSWRAPKAWKATRALSSAAWRRSAGTARSDAARR